MIELIACMGGMFFAGFLVGQYLEKKEKLKYDIFDTMALDKLKKYIEDSNEGLKYMRHKNFVSCAEVSKETKRLCHLIDKYNRRKASEEF